MNTRDTIYAIIIGGMAFIMAMDKLKPERLKSAFYVDLNIPYENQKVILKCEDGGNVKWIFKNSK